MREINNMGGIILAEILYKNEIELFAVHQETACIKIVEGHDWHTLPTTGIIEAPAVTPDEKNGGTIYKHAATIRFPRTVLSPTDANDIRNKIVEGCILRCKDPNGCDYIFGTVPYLLFGELNRVIGKKATTFTGYELKLSGTSLYPVLRYHAL